MPNITDKIKKFPTLKWLFAALLATGLILLPRAADKLSADYYGTQTGAVNGDAPANTTAYNYNGTTTGSSGSFSLTSNNSYCVGQIPVYTITAPSSWGGQTISWTSAHNGAAASQTSFTLGSGGTWSASGNSWITSDVGIWTKTATISGQTQSLNINVQNCGNTNGTGQSNNSNGTIGNSSYIGNGTGTFGAGPNAMNTAFPVNTGTNNNGSNSSGSFGNSNYIGTSAGTFGAGPNAMNTAFPVNTGGSSGAFGATNTPAPVYLANGTVLNGPQGSGSSAQTSGQGAYYAANGYLCKPPGSW
ncbi:MAG: hypothetical protein P4L74_03720 [Candidatus Doudnabacteria bacterium]|nr:hypothetical protein [Candidatus Doudnabacteria bacterium]